MNMADIKAKSNALKDKGNEALNAGKFDDAVKYYTEGIELDPNNHVLYSNRSAAYCKTNKYGDALADAEMTIKIKQDWPKGYSRKGAALAYLNRHEEALQAYEEGLNYDSNNQQLKDAIKEVESQLLRNNKSFSNPFSDPSMFMKLQNDPRTREYLKDPTYLKMLTDLQQNPGGVMSSLKDERMLTTLQVLLGVDLSTMGGDEEMRDDDNGSTKPSNRSSQSPPKQNESNKRKDIPEEPAISEERKQALEEKEKGNAAYKKKDFETALQHYEKAIELDPTDMTFLNNKAAVFFEQKDYQQCIKQCEKAIEVGHDNRADFKIIAKAYSRMANAYFKLNDFQNARHHYQKSLTEHRTPETLSKLSDVDRIIKEEERKKNVNPELALEEKNKGNEFFQKGNYPQALKHYSEAIKRNPDDAKLYSNRAACYQKLAEFPLALKDCETCVKLEPDFVKGHIRKGMALMALKEHNKAMIAFQKALDIDPNSPEALDGYRKCTMAQSSDPEEVRKRAMADPEVQRILSDPAMRIILEQMQSDPKAVHEHLKNPDVAAKIQKLLESGLITIR